MFSSSTPIVSFFPRPPLVFPPSCYSSLVALPARFPSPFLLLFRCLWGNQPLPLLGRSPDVHGTIHGHVDLVFLGLNRLQLRLRHYWRWHCRLGSCNQILRNKQACPSAWKWGKHHQWCHSSSSRGVDELVGSGHSMAAGERHPLEEPHHHDLQPGLNGRLGKQSQGEALGGSSTFNGAAFMGPLKLGNDAWAKLGKLNQRYHALLPYYKRAGSVQLPVASTCNAMAVGLVDASSLDAGPIAIYFPGLVQQHPLAKAWNEWFCGMVNFYAAKKLCRKPADPKSEHSRFSELGPDAVTAKKVKHSFQLPQRYRNQM